MTILGDVLLVPEILCNFTHLKVGEINCKIRGTRKIFAILYSAQCDKS